MNNVTPEVKSNNANSEELGKDESLQSDKVYDGPSLLSKAWSFFSNTSTPLGLTQTQTTTQVTSPNDQEISKEVISRDATFNVRNPGVLKDSHEQTSNNEIVTLQGKKKRFIQHPEITKTTCHLPGCNGIICLNLCGRFEESQGIGHVTHNVPNDPTQNTPPNTKIGDKVISKDGKDFYKISETDFDGENKEQYARLYSNPHDVDPTDIDTTRSDSLNKNHEALETILKNAK